MLKTIILFISTFTWYHCGWWCWVLVLSTSKAFQSTTNGH